jgi:Gram-negative porin
MRKLLLAGSAMLGAAALAQATASAQTPPAPQLAAPPMGTLITPNFGKSANDNNNYQAVQLPGAVANPTPGSMVIRLNGLFREEATVEGSTGDIVGGNKLAPYSLGTLLRLYPGVDGMATNGLRWGAQAEIRENFQGQGFAASPSSSTTSIIATNAQNSSSTTGNSGLTCAQTLYVRRAFVWVAQDQVGIFRIGQADGVSGIFDNGVTTFQNVGVGLWDGDVPDAVNGNTASTFPWLSQDGADYGTERAVYLSPQFAGVDFGFAFAPNNGNGGGTYNCSNAATVGCPSLSSSNQVNTSGTPTDNFRFRNQVQAGLRYQGIVGPAAIYAFGDYIGSGVVNYTGPPLVGGVTSGIPVGSKYNGQAQGVTAGFVGAAVTIAGFQFGGAWQGGQYNGTMAPTPKGANSAQAYLVGFKYTNGPYSIGASWYGFDSQGAVQLTGISQRHENAFGAGGNWQITPGLQAFFEYIYGTRHQGDFNFVTASVGKAFNDVKSQALLLGLQVGW